MHTQVLTLRTGYVSQYAKIYSLVSDFSSPQGTGKLIWRAIFMQKNSGEKLPGNEICMLASEKETVFPRLMNNPCLLHNSYGSIKCTHACTYTHTHTHTHTHTRICRNHDWGTKYCHLAKKLNNMICVSKHSLIA